MIFEHYTTNGTTEKRRVLRTFAVILFLDVYSQHHPSDLILPVSPKMQ